MSHQDVRRKSVLGGSSPRRRKRRMGKRSSNVKSSAYHERWSLITGHLLKALESQSEQIRHLKLQLDVAATLASLALAPPTPSVK